MGILVALLCLLVGCGLEVVELGPHDPSIVMGDVPADAIARFQREDGAMMDPKMLSLRYPEERTALPANIAPIRFDWTPSKADAFELRLNQLHVYTTETSVVVPTAQWNALLQGESLTVELRALDKKMLKRSEPRTFIVRPALNGQLYFGMSSAAVSDLIPSPADDAEFAAGAVDFAGKRVARVGRSRIDVFDRNTNSTTTLSAPEGSRIAEPSWSPDGSTVVFSYWPPELGLADDLSDEHDGSQLARFVDGVFSLIALDGEKMNPRRPRYSFDGTRIAFELKDNIAIVPASGGMARRLMCDGMMMPKMEMVRAPAWLAGDWLAFISTRPYLDSPMHAQVWLREVDDTCSAPLWFPAQDVNVDYASAAFGQR